MKITNEQLSSYLDNALSPEERAGVDRALAESPELRQELADLRQLSHLLKEVPAPKLSEQFYRHVLEKTTPQPKTWLQWTVPLLGAAAAAMVMIFIVGEKKGVFRRSVREEASVKARVPQMAMSAEVRAKGDVSYDKGGEDKLGQVREKGWSLEGLSLKDLASPPPSIVQLPKAPKMVSPRLALSEGAGKSDRQRMDEHTTLESGRRGSGPLETEMPEVLASKDKSSLGNVSEKYLSKKQMNLPAKLVDPGLLEMRTAESRRSSNGSVPQTISTAKSLSIPEETLLTREWRGDSSGISEYREVVIKDEASWGKLWAEHQSNRGTPPPAPTVNFKKFMIVGIFLGDRGSSGYNVQMMGIEEVGKDLLVSYKETQPASGGMQLTVMTQPYHLKAIPRTNRPVRFVKE